jgi:hypothetical protein
MSERPLPSETLAANLAMLLELLPEQKSPLDWLAKKSGVSKRMIQYILKCERTATVNTAQALAEPFGLTGWQLITPGLRADLVKNGRLERLVQNFYRSTEEGRDYIFRVSEHEAKYGNGNGS